MRIPPSLLISLVLALSTAVAPGSDQGIDGTSAAGCHCPVDPETAAALECGHHAGAGGLLPAEEVDATWEEDGMDAIQVPDLPLPGWVAAGDSRWRPSALSGRAICSTTIRRLAVRPPLLAPGNVGPVVAGVIPNQGARVGTGFSYVVPAGTFSDGDGDVLVWSATGLPAGLLFADATRTIFGVPAAIGVSPVTISVSDGNGHTASTTFVLVVAPAAGPVGGAGAGGGGGGGCGSGALGGLLLSALAFGVSVRRRLSPR